MKRKTHPNHRNIGIENPGSQGTQTVSIAAARVRGTKVITTLELRPVISSSDCHSSGSFLTFLYPHLKKITISYAEQSNGIGQTIFEG